MKTITLIFLLLIAVPVIRAIFWLAVAVIAAITSGLVVVCLSVVTLFRPDAVKRSPNFGDDDIFASFPDTLY